MILALYYEHCILCLPFKLYDNVEGTPSPHPHNKGNGHMVSTTTTSDDASLPPVPPLLFSLSSPILILLLCAALLSNSSSLIIRISSNIAAMQDSGLWYVHRLEPTPPSSFVAVIIGALLGATGPHIMSKK